MEFVPPNKKAQQEIGIWKADIKTLLVAGAFLIIFYILFRVIISRFKSLYF